MENGIKKQQHPHLEALLYIYATPTHQRKADEIAKHLLLSPEEMQAILTQLMDENLIDNLSAQPAADQTSECILLSPTEMREVLEGLKDEELVTRYDLYKLTQVGIQKAESL